MVTIIDYGLGNLASVQRAFNHLNVEVKISSDKNEILNSERLVLPGVGAFGQGMQNLAELDLINTLKESSEKKIPILGICLGMQLLFTRGEELGDHLGLNLIEGEVLKLSPNTDLPFRIKVPHVGWNTIFPKEGNNWNSSILEEIKVDSKVYFVHSFAGIPKDKNTILSETFYGGQYFCSSVQKENIIGCQFHPEKSGTVGLKILKKFLEWRI